MISRNGNTEYTVVQGPDRLDILTAFANWSECVAVDQDRPGPKGDVVHFVTKDGKRDVRFYVAVTSVQHEYGSGKTWNIEGYVTKANPMPDELYDFLRGQKQRRRRVHITYRTGEKRGELRLLPYGVPTAPPEDERIGIAPRRFPRAS